MSLNFNARISQEHSENVNNLALNVGVPSENIIFKKDNCPLDSIKIYIQFDNEFSFNQFSEQIKAIPCILEKL